MTLTILVSVSLLALVSSARPLPKPEEHWKGLQLFDSGEDADIQQAVQAVVNSHADLSEDLKAADDVQIQLASIEEVQAYLSTADGDAIKGLIPLIQDELHSPDEKELYELLNHLGEERGGRSPVPDEALDSMSVTSPSSELSFEENVGSENAEFTFSNDTHFVVTPVLVVAASCIVALLALCCVGAALYIVEVLRKSIFRSAWDILPQIENAGRKGELSYSSREVIKDGSSDSEKMQVEMPGALVVPITTPQLHRISSHASLLYKNENYLEKEDACGSECGDGDDVDVDEKFFDAESPDQYFDSSQYGTPVSTPVELPPGLPALAAAAATVAAVAVAHGSASSDSPSTSPEMRQVPPASSSPAGASSRPTWSVRATEASALVHAQDSPERERERRRGMFAMPELDAALAMQLRPGLGIGADAAWLVRFVMALFGWCAVLMNGR